MTLLPPTDDGVTVADLPSGYLYRATRYADVILREAFPRHFADLTATLDAFTIDLDEVRNPGGNRTPFVSRFDESLRARGWGRRNVDVETTIDGQVIARVRSHEIDMFAAGSPGRPYPGVAVEMEWNNKDPFFDRDLTNYYTLHRAGALAVGVIVTRGPRLQRTLKAAVRDLGRQSKYGQSTTHWNKLTPRVDLGGGGECPLLLVGIEPERVPGRARPGELASRRCLTRRATECSASSPAASSARSWPIRRGGS
jgi:hypothetical protein